MLSIDGSVPTEAGLRQDLVRLGVPVGATLMVHSSLRSIGWVVGGAPTVVRSLLNVVGDSGTVAMPAATPLCADPATWASPRVPEEDLETVREHLPVFDAETTPTSMGAIPETFRNWPGTLRSNHPLESVCARGPLAHDITRAHPLAFSEGEGGPFGRLYDAESWILLLGVGFNRCTALHYAESLVSVRRLTTVRFPEEENGNRTWREVPNVADDNDTHFPVVGSHYLATGGPRLGSVGEADAVLFPMRELVDFAVKYFESALLR